MIEFLGNSIFFCFGYGFNIFNLVFPEALHLLTKKATNYDRNNPKSYWIIVLPSMLIPFGWVVLSIILVISRQLILASDELLENITDYIKI